MGKEKEKPEKTAITATPKKASSENILTTTLLSDVKKIEFPFTDDPEEYYIIALKDREIEVNQVTGAVITEKLSPMTAQFADLSLDLHTGRINAIWAVILAIAFGNILFFIYSGFAMTLKRRASRIKNKFKANESSNLFFWLVLKTEVHSRFANAIQKQLMITGEKAHFSDRIE